MKIYLASSWKMKDVVMYIAEALRREGHEVDAFCDGTNGRVSFDWFELLDIMKNEGIDISKSDAKDMMQHWRVRDAFAEDKRWIDWADVLILLMPCGRSSHLEAGYAVGTGKKLYIVGGFEPGEFETMYGFADGMYDYSEFGSLLTILRKLEMGQTDNRYGAVKNGSTPWLVDFEDEMVAFPNGTYDDQVDTASYAFLAIMDRTDASRFTKMVTSTRRW